MARSLECDVLEPLRFGVERVPVNVVVQKHQACV